jgi:ribosomal protein S15P/S13E
LRFAIIFISTGDDAWLKVGDVVSNKQQSCHPRVVNGETKYSKVNTAKPSRKGIATEKLARMQKHFEQHPNDKRTAVRLAKNGTA